MKPALAALSACREFGTEMLPIARPPHHRDHPAERLDGLKVDAGFAPERGIDDDPLQIIVSLKANAQCFSRSSVDISRRARSSRACSSGRLSLSGGTERSSSSSPSLIL